MTIDDVKALLPILKANGVANIRFDGLNLEFHVEQSLPKVPIQVDTPSLVEVPESTLPPDLRTDNITNFDSVLNWSAPNQSDPEQPVPMTGDEAI